MLHFSYLFESGNAQMTPTLLYNQITMLNGKHFNKPANAALNDYLRSNNVQDLHRANELSGGALTHNNVENIHAHLQTNPHFRQVVELYNNPNQQWKAYKQIENQEFHHPEAAGALVGHDAAAATDENGHSYLIPAIAAGTLGVGALGGGGYYLYNKYKNRRKG